MSEFGRKYTMPVEGSSTRGAPLEDLHAWSIYRQNLNSDFTDSALGSDERSPLPYGNFQLREQTVQSILKHPRLAPRSELGSNMYAYLKFGLPRVFPPNKKDNSSGYDSENERKGAARLGARAKSETDLIDGLIPNRFKKTMSDNNLEKIRVPSSAAQFFEFDGGQHIGHYPNLLVHSLSYVRGKQAVIDNVFFDLKAGNIMALMATDDTEGTYLLDSLTGNVQASDRVSAQVWVNGNQIPISHLGRFVGYVTRDYTLHPDITVIQTMKFNAYNVENNEKGKLINVLLDDLGLSPVMNSLVESLTLSERQRLSVACVLLRDPDILCLDQPTCGMDIFDTFFLVEYLKQWAIANGKIVIVTIHPPTFEIFSMFSHVLLMSTGRIMFYGHKTEMLPYFAFIEYPCPAFKNPSDYYIDLVTLDTLSGDAFLESSQRINTLAESFRRKQERLPDPASIPPQHLPNKITQPSALVQFYSVYMMLVVLKFPWNLIRWVSLVLFSGSLSIMIGAIYWNIRLNTVQDQNNLNDRVSFFYLVNSIALWPVLFVIIHFDKETGVFVARDVGCHVYSNSVYIIGKTLLELPFICSILLSYVIPCYVMAGIDNEQHFLNYVGVTLLSSYTILTVLRTAVQVFRSEKVALTIVCLVMVCCSLVSYYPIHVLDIGSWCGWLRYVSPYSWTFRNLVKHELSVPMSFTCPNNPLTVDSSIVTQLQCQVDSNVKGLGWFGVDSGEFYVYWVGSCVVGGVCVCFLLGQVIFVVLNGVYTKKQAVMEF